MAIKRNLRKFGSRFAFELFIETMHDVIINGLRNYLRSIQPEDIPGMVGQKKYPPLEDLDLSVVGENIEHIEKISLLRLVEFIAEARPDLAQAIQDTGAAGAEYIVNLRQHILSRIKRAEFKPEKGVKLACCDKCGRKWPVKEEDANSITKCPFCGDGNSQTEESAGEDG